MSEIRSAIACNLDSNVLLAALPLFAEEKVQAIEWSFDSLFKVPEIPPWFIELLQEFGRANRLVGHGVYFSLFSGKWLPEQADWLLRLKRLSDGFTFDHISEHFGFMTGSDFHKGAPIGIPYTASTLAIGRDRLKRIYEACQCPVGLENLAFSYSLDEVKEHGEFLDRLVEPVNGFIILDLHNLYCQLHNFELDFEQIISHYPLHRVREIHISGGSWDYPGPPPGKKIRRDTHDDAVPEEVFGLLAQAMDRCPNLKYVVLEQLGFGLETDASKAQFQRDFLESDRLVQQKNKSTARSEAARKDSFLPGHAFELGKPLEDEALYAQQMQLSEILETSPDYENALKRLRASELAGSAWDIESWEPLMLETARRIAWKWKQGFV